MRFKPLFKAAALAVAMLSASSPLLAQSNDEFPFGLEMTLDAPPQPGSKRVPNLEIGDKGDTRLELWCKGGTGQFSIAGNTVIFMASAITDRNCPPGQAQADDALVAALTAATNWTRQGDLVTFTGSQTLRFRINSN